MRALIIALTLCAMSVQSLAKSQAEEDGHVTLKTPYTVGDFILEDHNGNLFDQDDLKNSWSMIFVGFTSCPDVCPTTLSNLEAVRADMGLRLRPDSIPRILFLAVDPARDKPVLKEYLGYFHPQYLGITGSHKQLGRLVKSLKAFYRLDKKTDDDVNYDVLHTAFVSIINPQGEIVAKISPPFHPHRTAEYLTLLIRQVSFDD